MPEYSISIINNDTVAGIIYTLLTISFLVIPFIIYYIKKNSNKNLINKYMDVFPNPDEALAAYNRDKENYNVVEPYKQRSIIAIIYYFVVFNILIYIVTEIAKAIYLYANGFSSDIINPESELYNEHVYEHMANYLNLILQIVIYAIALIGIVIIMFKPFIKDLKKISGKTFAFGAMGYGLCMAGLLIGTIIFSIIGITARKGTSSNEEAINSMFNQSPFAMFILFFVIVIMAPIVEELIFRKAIFNVIKDPRLALIISSLIFGGMHVISATLSTGILWLKGESTYLNVILEFVYIIQYTLMGLGFGIVYIKTEKNVCTPIVSHMINNGVSYVLMVLTLLFPDVFATITNLLSSIIPVLF